MTLESLLFSTKADRVNGQPSLNLSHVITMKEAVIYDVVHPLGIKRKSHFKDISGQKFGILTALEALGLNKYKHTVWRCLCDCGKETKAVGNQLIRGIKKSCRCLMGTPTHGMSRNPETRPVYKIMEGMINRCTNPKHRAFPDYGGRGIKVCPQWDHPSKFADFYAAVGPRPTPKHCLERLDNDGHYEPGNVVWATRAEEMRNTRRTVRITFRGETLCRKDMSEKYGIPDWTVKKRMKAGWSIEDALTIPVMTRWEHERRKNL